VLIEYYFKILLFFFYLLNTLYCILTLYCITLIVISYDISVCITNDTINIQMEVYLRVLFTAFMKSLIDLSFTPRYIWTTIAFLIPVYLATTLLNNRNDSS
jgi:hypothetical protein